MDRAAVTNSFSRSARIWPRTSRASPAQLKTPRIIMMMKIRVSSWMSVDWKMADRHKAKGRKGMAPTISHRRMSSISTMPPK